MEEAVSTTLEQLLSNTQLFLGTYSNKKKWTAIYPMANKLAEQYRTLYAEQPHALQARLTLYNPNYSYAINLVIAQCVVTAALCKSQSYDSKLSELYISTALIEHLCVGAQLNKLCEQTPFQDSDKKTWQVRHQLAAKVMLSGGDSAKPWGALQKGRSSTFVVKKQRAEPGPPHGDAAHRDQLPPPPQLEEDFA